MEFSLHLPLFLKMQGNENPDRDCREEFIFNNKIEREELRNGSDLSQLRDSLLWWGSSKSRYSEMREVRQYAEGKK